MDSQVKERVWITIKTATFIICLAGFTGNSFMSFKVFIGKQTITSQDLQHNEELALPSLTICSLSGYKKRISKYQDFDLKNYLNNTLELDEILLSVDEMTIEQIQKNKTFWEVTTTYNLFRGRCYTIRYIAKVNEFIKLFSTKLLSIIFMLNS